MRSWLSLSLVLLGAGLGPFACLAAPSSHASGGGTYSPGPGLHSEFQLSEAHAQCKIAHAVLPDGTVIQMFMDSTSIHSVTINSAAKTAVITGQMTSVTRLRSPGGDTITLSESVPFTVHAQDNGTPGAGKDFFGVTVTYSPSAPKTGGLNQFTFFASTPFGSTPTTTFSGVLTAGDIVVH